MELLKSTWRQRLSCASCAIALVWSLSLYKSQVSANPLSVAQRHWEVIATSNAELLVRGYRHDAILKRFYGIADADEIYQGQLIYSAWQNFFSQYKIKHFQVVEQQQHNRSVEAKIQITAQPKRGSVVVLSVSYQVYFDRTGKIIKEVWQTSPELSV